MSRVTEVAAKIGRLLELLDGASASALRLRGPDWFAWVTAGAEQSLGVGADTDRTEFLLTREGALVLVDESEAERLGDGEIVGPVDLWRYPWSDQAARERKVRELVQGGRVLSDHPQGDEEPLPPEAGELRWTLIDGEVERYRESGRLAAEAMTDALSAARPDWTERQLAAAGAAALLRRGLQPVLSLGSRRRQVNWPESNGAAPERLGNWAALSLCARHHGLHLSLTRQVSFGELDEESRQRQRELFGIEARVWTASRAGARLDDLYREVQAAYVDAGHPHAIQKHVQGGLTGYRPLERVAMPGASEVLVPTVALTWKPALDGLSLQDTLLLTGDRTHEVITLDPAWPSEQAEHGLRPGVLVLA